MLWVPLQWQNCELKSWSQPESTELFYLVGGNIKNFKPRRQHLSIPEKLIQGGGQGGKDIYIYKFAMKQGGRQSEHKRLLLNI